jgi:hypothetical protein
MYMSIFCGLPPALFLNKLEIFPGKQNYVNGRAIPKNTEKSLS